MRPAALAALQGCTHIVHGGDVGGEDILDALSAIAPVTAVRGNTDTDEFGETLPMTAMAQVAGITIYAVHILSDLDIDPAAAGVDVVVYGHSHEPALENRHGVLYLNPGSAGARRFHLPIALARLTVSDGAISVDPIDLDHANS
jgi:putative phosphoesterase